MFPFLAAEALWEIRYVNEDVLIPKNLLSS